MNIKQMKKDYHFLIGQRFEVGGDVYVVTDLTSAEDQMQVEVQALENGVSENGSTDETGTLQTFSLHDVIQWLLVDEEIELFNPNYLAAR